MKLLETIKSGKFIKITAGCLAAITAAVSCPIVMLSSKTAYEKYYKAAIEEFERNNSVAVKPAMLKDIYAELVQGKRYFADGAAAPVKEDIEVTAHFDKNGKDSYRVLEPSEYSLTVADDFSEKGGKITVSYTYTPDKKIGESVDSVTKTAEINVELTAVTLERITLKTLPYRVYYSDEMTFQPSGATVTAYFNDGHETVIESDKLTVENGGKLTVADKTANVSYTVNGVKKTVAVPVTVVAAAEYDDGKVVYMETEGEISVADGSLVSEAAPDIRATYESGNRLLLGNDEYEVSGNTERASFSRNCLLTCRLRSNKEVTCKATAKVVREVAAKNTTVANAQIKQTGDEFAVTDFGDNATVSFNITSSCIAKGGFVVRLASVSGKNTDLGGVLSLTVNGVTHSVPQGTNAGGDGFNNYELLSVVLYEGENSIVLSVAKNAPIAISSFIYQTRYDGKYYMSIGDYIEQNEDLSDLSVSRVTDWDSEYKPYIHGLCSDGTYIYGACTAYSDGLRSVKVKKIEPKTGETVAVSAETAVLTNEDFAGICYIDGKIITFMQNGKKYCTNADLSEDWSEYGGFDKVGYKDLPVRDAGYSVKTGKFVFRTGERDIKVVSKTGETVKAFSLAYEDGTPKRVSVTNDCIFALYSGNGRWQPVICEYDFNGRLIRRFTLSYDSSVFGGAVQNFNNTNVQGMVAVNDSLYFGVLKFSAVNGGDQTMILKADYPQVSERLEVNLSIGEYIEACVRKGVNPAGLSKRATPDEKTLKDATGWAQSGVSYGGYLYMSAFTDDNIAVTIYKIKPEIFEIVARSAPVTTGGANVGDSGKLFIKDGTLYVCPSYIVPNKLFCLRLEDFTGGAVFKSYSFPFKGVSNVKDADYITSADKYVTLSGGKLYYFAGNGSMIGEGIALSYAKDQTMKPTSVFSDGKYVYINYCGESQSVVPVDVFDMSGKKVTTLEISGINLGTYTNIEGKTVAYGYNVQSVFNHGGKTYALVCSRDGGADYCHLFEVNFDMGILE